MKIFACFKLISEELLICLLPVFLCSFFSKGRSKNALCFFSAETAGLLKQFSLLNVTQTKFFK